MDSEAGINLHLLKPRPLIMTILTSAMVYLGICLDISVAVSGPGGPCLLVVGY